MELVELGDKMAGNKLKNLLEMTAATELVRDVVENNVVYEKIKKILK
jgi:hypothetical protein